MKLFSRKTEKKELNPWEELMKKNSELLNLAKKGI